MEDEDKEGFCFIPSTHDPEEMYGPTQADDAIRHALAAIWRSLPKSRRDPDTIEKEFLRLTNRAIKNYRDDVAAFGENQP